MTPKTGAIRLATLRLFLPGGGWRLTRPGDGIRPPDPGKRSAAGHDQRISASRRSPGSASQSAASGFSTPLRYPV
ncbi:hypothetical protein ELP33_25910 [Klebsiella quasipneumoniae]|nr:hypothetical protein [Klebsiella quasipneumoniae]MBM5563757.1 hypothetical protein [Klebsiella quasipneumoniae]QSI13848.1 hypothetical protein FA956_19840 [Klebsiella quasipneumoniae]